MRSVSYTHLDVYKRQGQWEAELKKLAEKISSLENTKKEAEDRLDSMNGMIERLRQAIEEKNGDVIEALNRIGGVRAKLQRYDAMLEQIQIRKSELNQSCLLYTSRCV